MSKPLEDSRYEKFARFVAQGKTPKEAAIAAGYAESHASNQGYRLTKRAEVRRRIDELQTKVAESVVTEVIKLETRSISERLTRVNALQERWDKLQQVIKERGEELGMEKVPGGRTGLIVRQVKALQVRSDQEIRNDKGVIVQTLTSIKTQLVPEYSVDIGLLRELRAIEEQTSKELGQTKPTEINVSVDLIARDARKRIEERLNRLAPRVTDERAAAIDPLGPQSSRVN